MVTLSIISGRGAQFTSKFWRSFHKGLGTQVKLSTAFNAQTDCQAAHTINTLEDMLRACIIDFNVNWDEHFTFMELSYNNSVHLSISMDPFEVLYDTRCISLIGWVEVGESSLLGPNMTCKTLDKLRIIKNHLQTTNSRQNSYVDQRRRDLEFEEGDNVYLNISPMKGVVRFWKKRKLSYLYVGPY